MTDRVETLETPERTSAVLWRRRALAMLLGLSAVVSLEGFCRLAGWGDPVLREDPYVGFSGTRPLFIRSDDGERYLIPRVRQEYFANESFPAVKPPGSRRIFCLGGSTVQGRPWSIETSFTAWLELALNEIDDEHDWDVVNCGGISYASYRLVPILEECLQYEPDLIILCTGHNEFLEDRTYADVSRSPLLHQMSDLRLVNLARGWIDAWERDSDDPTAASRRTTLALETEPILNFNGGLAAYHRDDAWQQGVIEHYAVNVTRMIQRTRAAGLPILLMQPASNLRDCPPFKSEHPADWSSADEDRWSALTAAAWEARAVDRQEALRLYQAALELDPDYSLTHFRIGGIDHELLDYEAARAAFVRARDTDICPLRMVSALEERLQAIAKTERVPLLDMHALLEANTPDGILGDRHLVDHIHPSIEGHQQIADALVERLAEMDMVTVPPGDWTLSVRAVQETYFESLPSAYFLRGQNMLEGLRAWSEGRADGPPAAERFPHRFGR